jgi:hypothetical protein
MILNVIDAEYKGEYKVFLTFNDGQSVVTDLKETIFTDSRRIFSPLRDIDYFKTYKIRLNTITWDNEADFAPEFLLELGRKQESLKMVYSK